VYYLIKICIRHSEHEIENLVDIYMLLVPNVLNGCWEH
jgi:hypothetical protein